MTAATETLIIYAHLDELGAQACERIRVSLGRPVEFRPLPVAPPVLPGLTRLRKLIAEYDAADDARHEAFGRWEADRAPINRLLLEDARTEFDLKTRRLAKFASLDAPAILDFAAACPCGGHRPAPRTGPIVAAPRANDEVRALAGVAFGDGTPHEEKLAALEKLSAYFKQYTASAPTDDASTLSSLPPSHEKSGPERGEQ